MERGRRGEVAERWKVGKEENIIDVGGETEGDGGRGTWQRTREDMESRKIL